MRLDDAWRIDVCGLRVVVSGDLDLVTAKDLRKAIASVSGEVIELDLSGVIFVDWVGLQVLLDARVDHPQLRIVAASAAMLELLEASGTADYLNGSRSGPVDHPSRWRDTHREN